MRTAAALFLIVGAAHAAEWYVSGTGVDTNAGTSSGAAFRTLAKAAGKVAAGDTVWLMDGIYANVTLTISGTPAAWITWKAVPGHAPELRYNGWQGVNIKASYQVIDGLTVTGAIDQATLAEAEADALNASPNGLYNGTGINVDGRLVTAKYHHVTIRNCTVRKNSGGGISAIQSDYITIENCLIRDNCWYGRYAQSGISLWQCWNSDTVAGYHNVLRRNTLCNNKTLVKWVAINALSDGNGIIFDDSKNTQNGSTLGAYTGRTLISDNLSVANGGSGIHSYMSEHVDIVNNTAYQNGQVVGYPEIFANSSNDVRILNNIMVARNGAAVNGNSSNTNVTYDYNLYFNGTVAVSGAHDVVGNPLFVAPGLDVATADFRLLSGSPAIDSGTTVSGVTSTADRTGLARPQGSALDRGAYESPANLAPTISLPSQAVGPLVLP
jgi:parallel beta-helix repeat protein